MESDYKKKYCLALDLKNDPCPQSCWKINILVNNPAAIGDIANVRKTDISRAKNIAAQIAPNNIIVTDI